MSIGQHSGRGLVCVALAVTLVACQSMPPSEPTAMDGIQGSLQEAEMAPPVVSSTPLPDDVAAALLPPLKPVDSTRQKPREPRFDLKVDNVPAYQFFMGLVEGTPYNMVVHPDVGGSISLSLKNVTVQEVMQTVHAVYGYDFRRMANGFMIMPNSLQVRIYQVAYLNVMRTGKSRTWVTSGQVSAAGGEDESIQSSSSGATQIGGKSGGGAISGSVVSTMTEADFWRDLGISLQALLGDKKGRTVVVSAHSGVVLVRALPKEHEDVARFLGTTQDAVQRQVILEARILEVELSDGFQSGINWALLGKKNGNFILGSQTGGGSIFDSGRAESSGSGGNLDPDAPDTPDETAFSTFGGVFSLAVDLDDFKAFIELLETQGNVQTLSNPRIATLNNQRAIIKVGSEEYFVTDVSNTTVVTSGDALQNPDITLTPFFSGIALDVTPQISDDDEVTLHIHPSVTEVRDQQKEVTVGDQTQSLPLAFTNVRETDSIISARSGQIVVIGGLIEELTRESVASTPLLGDLPLVGPFFRHTQQISTKSELVILLRATVVKGPGTWSEDISATSARFEALDRGFHYGGKSEVFGTLGDPSFTRQP